MVRGSALCLVVGWLTSCGGSGGPMLMNLMPAPAAFTETGIELYDENEPIEGLPYEYMLYATDRAPAEDHALDRYYSSQRGRAVRIGRATIGAGREDLTWADAARFSIMKGGTEEFPIKVSSVEDYGILEPTVTELAPLSGSEREQAKAAERRYVREINRMLGKSRSKTINVYLHGFRVTFENPLLVSAELSHFLGDQGLFIAYSWPATPKLLAYLSDSETAAFSARNLRNFIRFLAEETAVEKINLVAYSAGTRVLARAVADLALESKASPEAAKRRLKLGAVILMAGDVDRGILGGYLDDGAARLTDQFVVYMSDSDKALSFTRRLMKQERIGQALDPDTLPAPVYSYLSNDPNVVLVDVSNADAARAGNGHGYLRKSPWVSSDLLMTLAYGLRPEQRGLVKEPPGGPIWTFPPDYVARLREALLKHNPDLSGRGGS